jgi:tetratricopeptide (TPR) repeat protein
MSTLGHRASVLKCKLAVSLARAVGDPLVVAHRIHHLADVYRRLGRADLAEPSYQEALSIYREHQEAKPLDVANALRGFAILKESAGARTESRRLWQEAHDLYVKVDVSSGVAESAARLAALGM